MARAYDYLLGGAHNFAVDREVAEAAERIMPRSREIARLNRAFLRRGVLFLVESGIRQFLDIGSGVPTVGNVHEIAQEADPECRVVYVDKDPVAVAHSELMLQGNDRTAIIQADLRDPDYILGHQHTNRLLDFSEPIGLLTVMMLHFVPDSSAPKKVLGQYRDAVVSGSYLMISHVTADQRADQITEAAKAIKDSKSPDQLAYRSHAEVVDFFAGFDLVEPGVVGCGLWRPTRPGDISNDVDVNAHVYGGIGVKPADG
ncbi:MAG TPA: SAM-dependent methyltransferase [Pseudonocardiaceae bacterium]|nr:SAM-dependent methyltransferase [Pseudonocardiaceae bacterium]